MRSVDNFAKSFVIGTLLNEDKYESNVKVIDL